MTNTLKRWLEGTRTLESRLTTAFEQAAQTVAGGHETSPLELLDRAADELARQVHPSGRGRYALPFNEVGLTFVAATPEEQARFDAICAGPPSVHERLLRRLASAGCTDADLDVRVTYAPSAAPDWTRRDFQLSLARVDRESRAARERDLRVDVLVTHGTADRGAYTFKTLPIAIGRGLEVRDSRHQLLRVNHIAFTEGDDDVNRSVSRRHARIELDVATGRPRIIDDNSAQGTSVIRGGRGLAVPRGSRGLRLQSDDEVVLGQARLRVRVT
jgi:hypothetical protein